MPPDRPARSKGQTKLPEPQTQPGTGTPTSSSIAGARPSRKSKEAALEKHVWTSDLPLSRKHGLSHTQADDAGEQDVPVKKQRKTSLGEVEQARPGRSSGGEDHGHQPTGSEPQPADSASVAVQPVRKLVRRFKTSHVVLPADLESLSGEEEVKFTAADAPSSQQAPAQKSGTSGSHAAVRRSLASPNDHSPTKEDSDSHASQLSDDEEVLAEHSESEDETLETGDALALGARLAAEQAVWVSDNKKHPSTQIPSTSSKVPRATALTEADFDADPMDVDTSELPSGPVGIPSGSVALGPVSTVADSSNRHSRKNTVIKRTKLELRQRIEQPTFKTPAAAPATQTIASPPATRPSVAASQALGTLRRESGTVPNADPEVIDLDDIEELAPTQPVMKPEDYTVASPAPGSTTLPLLIQHPDIQDVIRAAMFSLERNIVVHDAFPDSRHRGRTVRLALVETVKSLQPAHQYRALAIRMTTDGTFTQMLAAIPNQRISSFRGKTKEKSDVAVASSYGLIAGKAKDKVDWLLQGLTYIYPIDFEKRYIPKGKPYQHPLVVSVLRETFFRGARSFASKHTDIFKSSLVNREEKEIPMVMLALVGTAIHASLTDWKSGSLIAASNFSTEDYAHAYNEHMVFLREVKNGGPLKYHTMMYKLYNATVGVSPLTLTGAAETAAMARLHLDDMEED